MATPDTTAVTQEDTELVMSTKINQLLPEREKEMDENFCTAKQCKRWLAGFSLPAAAWCDCAADIVSDCLLLVVIRDGNCSLSIAGVTALPPRFLSFALLCCAEIFVHLFFSLWQQLVYLRAHPLIQVTAVVSGVAISSVTRSRLPLWWVEPHNSNHAHAPKFGGMYS